MKLLFAPIKFILKLLIGLLIIPAIFLALLYKSVKVPQDDYNNQSVTIQEEVDNSIDTFIENDTDRQPLSFTISSDLANNEIRNQLLAQFNNTGSSDTEYVHKEGRVHFQGMWIDYKKDTLNMHAGVHFDLGFMKYKSALLLRFEIIDTEGVITLKLKKLNVGRIPLAWASGFASTIVSKTTGMDIEEMVTEQIGSFGEFNMKDRTLKIDLRNLAEQDDQNKELIKTLIDLVYSKDLVKFGISEDVNEEFALGLQLKLDKIEDRTPALELAPGQKINNDAELELFLKSKIDFDNEAILSSMLSTKPEFSLTELDINKVLEYFVSSNMQTTDNIIQEMTVGEDYSIRILTPYIKIENDDMLINVPIRLKDTSGNEFMTTIKLNVAVSSNEKDLVFDVNSVDLGSLTIEQEYITEILEIFGTGSGLTGTGTQLVLKDFAENFEQEGLKFDSLSITSNELVLAYEIEGMTGALEDLNNNPNVPQNVKDNIDDVLANPNDDTAINDLINSVEALTPAEQQIIFDTLGDSFLNPTP